MQDNIHNTDKKVSIQIDLSGYSFIVQDGSDISLKMQQRVQGGQDNLTRVIDSLSETLVKVGVSKCENLSIEVYYHTSAYVLVPDTVFREDRRDTLFREMHPGSQGKVLSVKLPFYSEAVLLYTIPDAVFRLSDITDARIDFLPSVYAQLNICSELKEYNRLTFDYRNDLLTVAVADREQLLLCNSFKAANFDTALYYVLNAVKTLALNPEQSVLYSMSPMSASEVEKSRRFLRDVVLL